MRRILLSILFAGGCSLATAEAYRFVAISKSTTVDYWNYIRAGVYKARDEFKAQGVEVQIEWVGPSNEGQVADQIALVEKAVKDKVQGIVLAPCDALALAAPVQAATAAKIPTVVIDSGMKHAGQISYIATDNTKGGIQGARRLGSLLEGKGKLVFMRSQKGAGATDAREKGFLETLKVSFPKIEIAVSDYLEGGTYALAEKAAEELLAKHPEAEGVFTPNAITSKGMLDALRKTGRLGKIKFVGFDTHPEILAALRTGEMQGTVVQAPMKMGYLGVKTLVEHLRGKPIEADIDTGCVLVTSDSLDKPAIAELLAPPPSF